MACQCGVGVAHFMGGGISLGGLNLVLTCLMVAGRVVSRSMERGGGNAKVLLLVKPLESCAFLKGSKVKKNLINLIVHFQQYETYIFFNSV